MRSTICKPACKRATGVRLRALLADMAARTQLIDQPGGVQADPAQDLPHLAAENMEMIHQEDTAGAPCSLQTTSAASDTMSEPFEKRLKQRLKQGSL